MTHDQWKLFARFMAAVLWYIGRNAGPEQGESLQRTKALREELENQ